MLVTCVSVVSLVPRQEETLGRGLEEHLVQEQREREGTGPFCWPEEQQLLRGGNGGG